MRRRLFTFLSATSLLLCAGVCVLWVRSHFFGDVLSESFVLRQPYHDSAEGKTYGYEHYIASSRGRIQLSQIRTVPYATEGLSWFRPADYVWRLRARGRALNEDPPDWQVRFSDEYAFLGFGWQTNPAWKGDGAVVIPHWFAFLAFGVLPLWWLGNLQRRRKQITRGLCSVCGYDLRATPDRCPECGAVPAA